MTPIIIYQSKTGFAKTYAEWLSKELNCPCMTAKEAQAETFASYDTIIYGGGIYAGKINGFDRFKARLANLKDKTLVVYATGATAEGTPEAEKALSQNLTPEERRYITPFYFQGGINYDKMSAGSKLLMSMFKKMLNSQKDKTPAQAGMHQAISHSFTNANPSQLTPLLNYLKVL